MDDGDMSALWPVDPSDMPETAERPVAGGIGGRLAPPRWETTRNCCGCCAVPVCWPSGGDSSTSGGEEYASGMLALFRWPRARWWAAGRQMRVGRARGRRGTIGTGVLGVPFAIRQMGAVLGAVTLCVVASISLFTLNVLCRGARVYRAQSYQELVRKSIGRVASHAVSLILVVCIFGTCVACTVVAADALSHLPVLGALVPGPAEFIGAVAATLLAARYVVTKEATPEEDLAAFGSTLPGEFPPADFGAAFAPVAALAKKAGDADLDALQEDLAKAPEAVQKWFGDLENPVETIAPPAAALGAAVLVGQVANFPVLALVFPRLLELAGVATVVQAVNKYGGEEGGSLKEDLAKVAARGGDAVKALAGKK